MLKLMNTLTIMSKLSEWSDRLHAWIIDNYTNPVLWIGIVVVGVLFFKIVFGALNKD